MMPSVDELAGQSLLDASEMYKFCGFIAILDKKVFSAANLGTI